MAAAQLRSRALAEQRAGAWARRRPRTAATGAGGSLQAARLAAARAGRRGRPGGEGAERSRPRAGAAAARERRGERARRRQARAARAGAGRARRPARERAAAGLGAGRARLRRAADDGGRVGEHARARQLRPLRAGLDLGADKGGARGRARAGRPARPAAADVRVRDRADQERTGSRQEPGRDRERTQLRSHPHRPGRAPLVSGHRPLHAQANRLTPGPVAVCGKCDAPPRLEARSGMPQSQLQSLLGRPQSRNWCGLAPFDCRSVALSPGDCESRQTLDNGLVVHHSGAVLPIFRSST